MSIKLILNIKASLDLFEAKVEAKICSDMLQICFPTIEVFTDIKFSKTKPQRTFFFLSVTQQNLQNDMHPLKTQISMCILKESTRTASSSFGQ